MTTDTLTARLLPRFCSDRSMRWWAMLTGVATAGLTRRGGLPALAASMLESRGLDGLIVVDSLAIWTVVGIYSDAAITGATVLRPEYQRLLQDAERGLFDVVAVEAVDRSSRRLADLAAFHDIVDFRKVKLFATDRGEINGLMVGLLGSMAQAFLEDLKGKTKRGLTGKIIAGLSAGSLGYG